VDLRCEGRVLYVSSVDVSLGNGPGVNEAGFISGLDAAIGDRAHFLIPKPAVEGVRLPVDRCTFVLSHDEHQPLRYAAHQVDLFRKAARLVRGPFDLICVRLDVLPLALYRVLLSSPVPFVLKTLGQGPLNVLGRRAGRLGEVASVPNHRMFSRLVKEALVADACSPSMVGILVERLEVPGEKIEWVDNAVDVQVFSPRPAAGVRAELGLSRFDRIVGYVGSRPLERGGLALVEAGPALVDLFPDIGLLIVGEGPGLGELRARATALGVVGSCVFTGQVPPWAVPAYVNAIDVGVSINRRPDRYHAAELKVRQYVACGKPVVVSPGGNDFVTEADLGKVVSGCEVSELADALCELLRRTGEEQEAFARRAREYAVCQLSYDRSVARRFELWSERYTARVTRRESREAARPRRNSSQADCAEPSSDG
jgi:glycosyltransferase involved in cell wall biosynthesis